MNRIEIRGMNENLRCIEDDSNEGHSGDHVAARQLPEMDVVTMPDDKEQRVEEAEEWKDKYLRLVAELENTKKRLAKRFEIELWEETGAVLLDLLPVADNLERIMKYAQDRGDKELERGLQISLEAFQDAMSKHGVSKIEARGKPFNPEYHEALGAVPTPQFEEGTVLEVEQTGYLLDGRVLRPAKVIIVSH